MIAIRQENYSRSFCRSREIFPFAREKKEFDFFLSFFLHLPFLFSDMQLFDIVNLIGMTPDNIPVLENIRFHDHADVLTPGKSVIILFDSFAR